MNNLHAAKTAKNDIVPIVEKVLADFCSCMSLYFRYINLLCNGLAYLIEKVWKSDIQFYQVFLTITDQFPHH